MNSLTNLLIFVAVVISSTLANPVITDPPSCANPSLSELQTKLDDEYLFHNPPSPNTEETNSTCPSGTSVGDDWPLSRSSVCPWSYVSQYDADRVPAVITQAACSCDSCLDQTTSEPRPDLSCTAIKYQLPVLRRGECVNGVSNYHQEYESVTVGCACMRPVFQSNRAPDIIG
ncbi:interleukin-17D-like [Asterias amurensis]|uniref:interleukin-17D-like n=1 Tax=Asterias amurensis TaxID=7602 RepID=UPI003AB6D936